MKKIFFLLCGLTLILGVLGCGQKNANILNFWTSEPPTEPVGKEIIRLTETFNKKSEHQVVIQYIPWDQLNSKLLTAIAGGKPPDIVLLDRFVTASYVAHNALEKLNDLAKQDNIKEKDYYKACWDECVYNNDLWAIPHHTDVRALYYRIDHFEEAGLDPEKPPRNWDELVDYAKKLTKKTTDGRITRIGFLPYLGNAHLHMWAWLNGGKFMIGNKITCNEPKIVEALEWMVKFQDLYGRKNVLSLMETFGAREMDPFIMGQLSMIVDGDWYVSVLKKFGPKVRYKIAPPPPPKGKKSLSWSGGFALAIPKGCKNKEKAWDYIKYMVSEKAQISIAENSGRIPALIKSAKFISSKYPDKKIFYNLMKVTKYRPVTPVAHFYWDQITKALEYSLLKQKTPQEALDDAAKNTQDELDRLLKKHK